MKLVSSKRELVVLICLVILLIISNIIITRGVLMTDNIPGTDVFNIYRARIIDTLLHLVFLVFGVLLYKHSHQNNYFSNGFEEITLKNITSFIISLLIILFTNIQWFFVNEAQLEMLTSSSKYNLLFKNYYNILGYSLRAGVGEEIIFRLFLISLFVFIIKKINVKIDAVKVSVVIASLLFIFIHPLGNFLFAFLVFMVGLGFGYLFVNNGLLWCIVVHFAADIIGFTVGYFKVM
ncbi:Abortive infection protein [Halothermothrix orenii H 168]|uniref:Abortive infection protein n=2 Tax=Halothermothrix orenii TaxID=31909 RepID=B8D1F7_HALOH|nr:Abortive infection protein [Halothermothrix orenii H 168]